MKMKSNKVNQLNLWSQFKPVIWIMKSISFNNLFYKFFLSKINTYKIKYEPNIKMIEKKNQNKLCYPISNQPNIKW
jgi:DNA-binding Xre family transcriptional regulator